jgi:hypothetical protein
VMRMTQPNNVSTFDIRIIRIKTPIAPFSSRTLKASCTYRMATTHFLVVLLIR